MGNVSKFLKLGKLITDIHKSTKYKTKYNNQSIQNNFIINLYFFKNITH